MSFGTFGRVVSLSEVDLPSRGTYAVTNVTSQLDGNAAIAVRGVDESRTYTFLMVNDQAGQSTAEAAIRSLDHLSLGDVIGFDPKSGRISLLWKHGARHNSMLLTEQCNQYCLMCSQPPKIRPDAWLFRQAADVVELLPPSAREITLTGGEPTLHPEALLGLLRHINATRPELAVHLLSNGRRFADRTFSQHFVSSGLKDLMVGIPLYAADHDRHDYIVQSTGAFDETIRGILGLVEAGGKVELRVVVQQSNSNHLRRLSEYIARNLPFVSQVVFMGLEMTGLARPNRDEVWIDPWDYRSELIAAVNVLISAQVTVKIYNHQLCVLPKSLWPWAVSSISDWKQDYLTECGNCVLRTRCGGVFSTSGDRVSQHLRPFYTDQP